MEEKRLTTMRASFMAHSSVQRHHSLVWRQCHECATGHLISYLFLFFFRLFLFAAGLFLVAEARCCSWHWVDLVDWVNLNHLLCITLTNSWQNACIFQLVVETNRLYLCEVISFLVYVVPPC